MPDFQVSIVHNLLVLPAGLLFILLELVLDLLDSHLVLHLQVFDVSLEVGLQVQFLGRGIHAALLEIFDHALHLPFPLHLLHCKGVVVLLELLERLQQIQVLIAFSLLLDLEVLVDLFDLALVLPADL